MRSLLASALLAACAIPPPPALPRAPAPAARPPEGLRVSIFSSATIPADRAHLSAGAQSAPVEVPVVGALVEHPKGALVFDPGPGPLADAARSEFPWSLFAGLVEIRRAPERDAAALLRGRGLDPRKVRYVALSHLHADHACAAADFEGAAYLVSDAEWRAAQTGPVGQALLGYPRPCVEALGQRGRLRRLHFEDGSYEAFAGAFDAFKDGSVLLVPTPGHTKGSMSLVVWLPSGAPIILTGDVAWVEDNWKGPTPKGWPGRLEEWDPIETLWSAQRVKQFALAHPGAIVVPAHDPDALARLKPWPEAYR